MRLLSILIWSFMLTLTFNCKSHPKPKSRSFLMGTIFWPPDNFNDSNIKKGIARTLESSDILTAQIPWEPADTQFIEKVQWIASLSREHHRKLIVNIDWLRDDRKGLRGANWNFGQEQVKEAYVRTATEVCRKYRPNYLNLGIEVNFHALGDPAGFRSFVDVYNKTKKIINDSFPEVKVAVTFQLELLFGLHSNWGKQKSLEVLKAFGDNLDIVAISTYPHSNTKEFTNRYYLNEVLKANKKPLGIFETGVPTNLYDEEKQKAYLQELLSYLQDNKRCELLVWSATCDTEVSSGDSKWAHYLGLLNYDLQPKKAWMKWQEWYKLPLKSK